MNEQKQNVIGQLDDFVSGEKGIVFFVRDNNQLRLPAFLIRYHDQCYAYLNRCGHIAMRLDFRPGEFFSDDGESLVCATHGAEYAPDTGACLGGPCFGVGLEPLEIMVQEGTVTLADPNYQLATD